MFPLAAEHWCAPFADDKRTAIHLAASEGLLPVVELLVSELSADHSPRDRWNNTPLNDAVRHKHTEVASFLTSVGATLGAAATVEADPATEMCSAAYKGDLARLTSLVRQTGYDVNVGDYDKRTAIHLAASEGNLDVVKLLVDGLGANHSPRDRWGGTPLNDALRHEHTLVIEYLKSAGATMGVQLVAEDNSFNSGARHKKIRGRATTRG